MVNLEFARCGIGVEIYPILLNSHVLRVVSAIAACKGESHLKQLDKNKIILADVSIQTI